MSIPTTYLTIARLSLAVVWILTAWASTFGNYQLGLTVLNGAGIHSWIADILIITGAGADLGIGLWILSGKERIWCYRIQIMMVITYSVLLTAIAPEFWAHPFGPLSKNLPIIALLLTLLIAEKN